MGYRNFLWSTLHSQDLRRSSVILNPSSKSPKKKKIFYLSYHSIRNPAVTIAMAWHGKFEWSKVFFYCTAQGLGAFCASLLVFLTYKTELLGVAGGALLVPPMEGATAGNFGTYPNNHASAVNGFVGENQPSIMQCLFDQ